jgi:hypothetical protein
MPRITLLLYIIEIFLIYIRSIDGLQLLYRPSLYLVSLYPNLLEALVNS